MKYNSVLGPLQQLLPQAKSILIVLPHEGVIHGSKKESEIPTPSVTIDHFATGLALYLSLQQLQKEATIVSAGQVLVGHTTLFGINEVQAQLPQPKGGNFILTLGNVASADGAVPTVEKMDYSVVGNDLRLVFLVKPGAQFVPQTITPSYEGGSYDLIFVIGCQKLEDLGNIYSQNQAVFTTHLVNIDNNSVNSQFGTTKVVDLQAASLSEMMVQLLLGLALPMSGDIATNVLTGIFAATNNLTSSNVQADTYLAVAEALRSGGKKPNGQSNGSAQIDPAQAQAFVQAFAPTPPQVNVPVPTTEDQPQGEIATVNNSETEQSFEPDWLTPKIYRGGVG